jgi:two-component system nitrate/nitrite response regulator NarL
MPVLSPIAPPPAALLERSAPARRPTAQAASLRLVVADDHPLFRQGIIRALDADGRFLVVGEAGDGATALALVRELVPDLALLDVRMPLLDGVDIVHALALHGPDVPVVLLSAFSDAQLVASALEAGAAAYLTKTQEREELCDRLATIAAGEGLLAPARLSPRDRLGAHGRWCPRLTRQEHELLQLAAKGLDKLAIARLLGVDEGGIRQRATGVAGKLDADTLDDAVAKARLLGLIR